MTRSASKSRVRMQPWLPDIKREALSMQYTHAITDATVEPKQGAPNIGGNIKAGVEFGPEHRLRCEDIESVALSRRATSFSESSLEAMRSSADILRAAHERGDEIYGLTTGFGPHVKYDADDDIIAQGCGLIAHLGAGWGQLASREVVRATMAARCQALAQGRSGVAVDAALALHALLEADITPAVPEVGSVGASGDLIPLAHVARVMTGDGRVLCEDGSVRAASEVLAEHGLQPIALTGRDALAVVNGTSFMTAYAPLAVARAERLLAVAEDLTGWAFRSLAGRAECLDDRLHEARGHVGQIASAANIAAAAAGGPEDTSRPLQEVYSLRCAPQFLGACRDQLSHARTLIERELSGVNDNPVVCGTVEDPAVLHGGNFQGQQVAFAADAANSAITQMTLLIERQLDVVLNPELNGGAPLLLAWQPGATSGMAGAQITATAIAADVRRNSTPSAVATMPTNGRNQDVVSMGTMAARVAYEQTDRAAAVLGVYAIALTQLDYLRAHGRAPGERVGPPAWLPDVQGFAEDRPLFDDINRLAAVFVQPMAS
ncbi:MAG: aromatic amino acid ammonia-lyase [Planctomycetota bacterium]